VPKIVYSVYYQIDRSEGSIFIPPCIETHFKLFKERYFAITFCHKMRKIHY
jgi:hypothetical protein